MLIVSVKMADKSIPLPKEFLPNTGEPTLPFKLWLKVFDNFVFMKDTMRSQDSKMSDEEKKGFFSHS